MEEVEIEKLLKEIKAFDATRRVTVRQQAPGVWIAKAFRNGYTTDAIKDTKLEVVREINRIVRWEEARKFLHQGECITTVNVGIPVTV